VSIRRACRALPVNRATYHYRSRRAGQAQLTDRIKEIAATRVRYGYRRIHVPLRREGWSVNPKRVYRLYRELGLQLRHKTPRRRVKAKLREGRQVATRANETWAMDFVHDQLATGRKLRVRPALIDADWKTASRPVQGWGAAHTPPDSTHGWIKLGGNVIHRRTCRRRRDQSQRKMCGNSVRSSRTGFSPVNAQSSSITV
jgi:hypothetical protein